MKVIKATVKRQALVLLNECNLKGFYTRVNVSDGLQLGLFFTAKSHKAGIPFHTIVNERSAWQHEVSELLLKHLKSLTTANPFLIPGFSSVI